MGRSEGVEGEVPVRRADGVMVVGLDVHPPDAPLHVLFQVGVGGDGGAFGHEDFDFRVVLIQIVEIVAHVDFVAAVAVDADRIDVGGRLFAAKHANGKVDQIAGSVDRIMIPDHDLRVVFDHLEVGSEKVADEDLRRIDRPGHARVVARTVIRLVLHRQVVDVDAFGGVGVQILDQILGIHSVIAGRKRSAVQALVGFHPGWRAPRRGHEDEVRIDRQGVFQDFDDDPVLLDRKLGQIGIGDVSDGVVIGVVTHRGGREVGSADGEADELDAHSVFAEDVLDDLVALWGLVDHPGGRIGEGGAGALKGFVLDQIVDGDRAGRAVDPAGDATHRGEFHRVVGRVRRHRDLREIEGGRRRRFRRRLGRRAGRRTGRRFDRRGGGRRGRRGRRSRRRGGAGCRGRKKRREQKENQKASHSSMIPLSTRLLKFQPLFWVVIL